MFEHLTEWLGYPVETYDPDKKPDFANVVYRITQVRPKRPMIGRRWESNFEAVLQHFLSRTGVEQAPAIIIGAYHDSTSSLSSRVAIDPLVQHHGRLPALKGIFLGDIATGECPSQVLQSDITPLFEAFPGLEHLVVRGSTHLSLQPVRHLCLRSLVFEGSGVHASLINAITGCVLPELDHLEIYLGDEEEPPLAAYRAKVPEIEPLLNTRIFPKLNYLGLRNSRVTDAIARLAANAPAVAHLQTLDLSLGTLTDHGGIELFKGSSIRQLQQLDLHHHYLSFDVLDQLQELPLKVNLERHILMTREGPSHEVPDIDQPF